MHPLAARAASSLARPLAVGRIALGLVLVVRTTALVNALPIPLARVRGPLLGWPSPGAAFAWGGFTLSEGVCASLAIVRTVAALLFLLGVRARIAGVAAGVLGFVALSQDPFGFIFTLHTLFLGTLAIALGEGTTELALVPERKGPPGAAASSATLLCVLLASAYGWAAIAKLNGEWLSGGTLRALAEDGLLTNAVSSTILAHPMLASIFAIGATASEAALAPLLILPRTRRAAVLGAMALHAALEVATRPDVMSFVMLALLLGATPPRAREASPAPSG